MKDTQAASRTVFPRRFGTIPGQAAEDKPKLYILMPEEDEKLGTIGHIRVDFGYGGDEFRHTWRPRGPKKLNSLEFKRKLDQVVNQLRRGRTQGSVHHAPLVPQSRRQDQRRVQTTGLNPADTGRQDHPDDLAARAEAEKPQWCDISPSGKQIRGFTIFRHFSKCQKKWADKI